MSNDNSDQADPEIVKKLLREYEKDLEAEVESHRVGLLHSELEERLREAERQGNAKLCDEIEQLEIELLRSSMGKRDTDNAK